MLLSAYLDPIDLQLFEKQEHPNTMGRNLLLHQEGEVPDYFKTAVCLVALPDQYEVHEGSTPTYSANSIRAAFYKLFCYQHPLLVADMGNLRPGPTREQTDERISHVVELLHHAGNKVILIGSRHAHTLEQLSGLEHYWSKEDSQRPIALTVIDSKLDMDYAPAPINDDNYLNSLFFGGPKALYDFGLIGYQSYLVDQLLLSTIEQSHFSLMRLGQLRENPDAADQLISQADVVSIDVSALKSLAGQVLSPTAAFGLTPEELVRLMHYAGLSPKLKSLGIYGYDQQTDQSGQLAHVLAVSIWYMLEGIAGLQQGPSHYQHYRILREEMDDLLFIHHVYSDRWWVAFTTKHQESLDGPVPFFGCKSTDYTLAVQGELSDRLVLLLNRLTLFNQQQRSK